MNLLEICPTDFTPFEKNLLIPCIVQSDLDGQVLMLAYLNQEAFEKTLATRTLTFFSRSRQSLWVKGETSGNRLSLKSLHFDCDQDTLLALVSPTGPTCHLNHVTCFGSKPIFESPNSAYQVLNQLYTTILERKKSAQSASYTQYLFQSGLDKILKKVGEEASEVIIAAKNSQQEPLLDEIADLIYHLYVLLAQKDLPPEAFLEILKGRAQ